MQETDKQAALSQALQMLAENKKNPDNWNRAAIAYLQNADLETAVEYIGHAIELVPNDPLNYSNRARILYTLSRYAEALQDYDKAIELEPTATRYSSRAVVHTALDHTGATLHDLTAAIELEPSAQNYLNRAAFFANKGLAADALLNMNKVIELEPTNPNHRLTRANLAFATDRFELGIEDVEQAINYDQSGSITFGLKQLANQLEQMLPNSPQPEVSLRLINLIRNK
jgi:tetratricopeptide (TPR) repeat protein